MTDALVPILMGSRSDLKHAQTIASALEKFGIVSEIRIASAHKTPAYLLEALAHYEADPRPKVYITIAGRSNALSGMVDCAGVRAGDRLPAAVRCVWRRRHFLVAADAQRSCPGGDFGC